MRYLFLLVSFLTLVIFGPVTSATADGSPSVGGQDAAASPSPAEISPDVVGAQPVQLVGETNETSPSVPTSRSPEVARLLCFGRSETRAAYDATTTANSRSPEVARLLCFGEVLTGSDLTADGSWVGQPEGAREAVPRRSA
jgi:hypothetical protein